MSKTRNQQLQYRLIRTFCLLGIMLQPVIGSPVHPEGQTQIGLWLTTRHWASLPQVPGQGSWHLKLTHACDGAHSELDVHSGLHSGGTPRYPARQEHAGTLPTSRHWLLGPHGVGTQGLSTTFGWGTATNRAIVNQILVETVHYQTITKTPSHFLIHPNFSRNISFYFFNDQICKITKQVQLIFSAKKVTDMQNEY